MVIARRRVTCRGNRTRLTGCFGQFIRGALRAPLLCAGSDVTDREMWDLAVAALRAEYAALSPSRRSAIKALVEEVKGCKRELHAIVERVCAGEICASCGGECCLTGKFHVTVVDLLVYMAAGRELFTPEYGRELCPYLGEGGCFMASAFRPFNCTTFNCERVEWLLEPGDKELFQLRERKLRALYRQFEEEFGNRFMGGVLLNCERDILRDRLPILRGESADRKGCRAKGGIDPAEPLP